MQSKTNKHTHKQSEEHLVQSPPTMTQSPPSKPHSGTLDSSSQTKLPILDTSQSERKVDSLMKNETGIVEKEMDFCSLPTLAGPISYVTVLSLGLAVEVLELESMSQSRIKSIDSSGFL